MLFFCGIIAVASAQTTPAKKAKKPAAKSVTAKPSAKKTPVAAAKKPAARPTLPPPAEPAASTLTFPSTEPDNAAAMDAAKKQQLYDELHGVKNQNVQPQTGKNPRNRPRDTGETATRTDRTQPRAARTEARSYIGVRVGGNYNTYLEQLVIQDGTNPPFTIKPDSYYGFHAGVVFQFGSGRVAFQPEINFNQDQVKTTTVTLVGTTPVTSATTVSLSSLVVPLLAKFQFGQPGSTRFFVNAGPYGAYSLETSMAGEATQIAYGGALGLGVGIPAGAGKLTLEARGYYLLGATNSNISFGDVPFKPLTAQLSVGYLFPLGGR